MIEKDTIRLLRECDAGAKMGLESFGDVLPYVKHETLRNALEKSRETHCVLEKEIREALHRFGDSGKDPEPIAEKMSWLKTNVKLLINESDSTIAELMTDGCHMGVKSLQRYLNQYSAADEASKHIAKKLIRAEKDLAESMAPYL